MVNCVRMLPAIRSALQASDLGEHVESASEESSAGHQGMCSDEIGM